MIKAAIFDIDGTLVNLETKAMSTKTIYTLKQLKENGILICIATGRSPISLPKFNGIEFDAYLTFNGSYCFNKDSKIHSNPLLKTDVETLLQNAKNMNRPVSIATANRLAANGVDDDLITYYGFANLEPDVADDFEELSKGEIFQVMLSCKKEEYEEILKNTENAKIAAWWDRAVDIIPANGGKGAGIQKMLDCFGISKDEAIAFGDGNNDIEMFEAVGTGIAMGNASAELKKIATSVCKTVAEDGIYHFCVEHGMIKERI